MMVRSVKEKMPGGSVIYTTAGLSFKQQDAISWNILYQWRFLKEGGFVVQSLQWLWLV